MAGCFKTGRKAEEAAAKCACEELRIDINGKKMENNNIYPMSSETLFWTKHEQFNKQFPGNILLVIFDRIIFDVSGSLSENELKTRIRNLLAKYPNGLFSNKLNAQYEEMYKTCAPGLYWNSTSE